MHIALITSEYKSGESCGGRQGYFFNLASCLSAAGHEVEIFTSGESGSASPLPGVRLHYLGEPKPPFFAVHAAEALLQRHREIPFDIAESAEFQVEGYAAMRLVPEVAHVVRLHAPTVMLLETLVDRLPIHSWLYRRWRQMRILAGALRRGLPVPPFTFQDQKSRWDDNDTAERNAVAQADLVIVMNDEMRRLASDYWSIAGDRIVQCPNPGHVPPEAFSAPDTLPSHPVIGYAGRIERRKGVRELARALRRVLPRHPEWHVAFAGGIHPEDRNCLEDVRRQLDMFGERIHFVGILDRSQMPGFYTGLEICAVPSFWETFHYAALEGMLAGKAVIAGRTGAAAEMLDEGRAGFLVEPGNIRQLTEALDRLMSDAGLRRELGAAARERALTVFGEKTVTAAIVEAYKAAMSRRDWRLAHPVEHTPYILHAP